MTQVAISVKNVSKKYSIGKQKDSSLRGSLARIFAKKAHKFDEFLALDNVSFDIQRGDVVGIIGKNGAGKSTLLKILSQITRPSAGEIEINGRVASLLEVGTGFHPELTGRENVFLNGTILGMTRKEVASKFDEIVAFSGVEKFIDTPVKHYSSGMYVRLAFAVAAHLEPEILIIDEVLAVGDAEFQKKCLGKMKDVAGEGRTVLFVSHQLQAISNLCNKGILLKNGKVEMVGEIEQVLNKYNFAEDTKYQSYIDASKLKRERGMMEVFFSEIFFNETAYFSSSKFQVNIKLDTIGEPTKTRYVNMAIHIVDENENQIYHLSNLFVNRGRAEFSQKHLYSFEMDELNLKQGIYKIWFWLEVDGVEQDVIFDGVILEVFEGNIYNYSNSSIISGCVQPNFRFEIL